MVQEHWWYREDHGTSKRAYREYEADTGGPCNASWCCGWLRWGLACILSFSFLPLYFLSNFHFKTGIRFKKMKSQSNSINETNSGNRMYHRNWCKQRMKEPNDYFHLESLHSLPLFLPLDFLHHQDFQCKWPILRESPHSQQYRNSSYHFKHELQP